MNAILPTTTLRWISLQSSSPNNHDKFTRTIHRLLFISFGKKKLNIKRRSTCSSIWMTAGKLIGEKKPKIKRRQQMFLNISGSRKVNRWEDYFPRLFVFDPTASFYFEDCEAYAAFLFSSTRILIGCPFYSVEMLYLDIRWFIVRSKKGSHQFKGQVHPSWKISRQNTIHTVAVVRLTSIINKEGKKRPFVLGALKTCNNILPPVQLTFATTTSSAHCL